MIAKLRFLFLGDLVGKPGCMLAQKWIPRLREQKKIDAVIVNAENAANNGKGLTPKIAEMLKKAGAFAVTTGNHIWGNREIYTFIKEKENDYLVRPLNFPSTCPGKGYYLGQVQGHTVAIINAQGRVFMHENLDCPFKALESLLTFVQTKTKIIFVDFHAETTSEKAAIGIFLDGRVSGVYGTHTHIQTADERIMPHGTSFISDLGAARAVNSCLGIKSDIIIQRFLTQMPQKHEVETTGPFVLSGLIVDIDTATGKSLFVERINIIDEELTLSSGD